MPQKTQLNNFKHNVHESAGKYVARVQGDIDREIYAYFFHHLVPWGFGARQAIINFFFQRLYEECLERGIPPVWNETSEQTLLDILNNINFNGTNRPTES